MLLLLFLLLLTLVLAGVVLVYVAFPYRGEPTPFNPAVGETLVRTVHQLPTVGSPLAETADERRKVYASR